MTDTMRICSISKRCKMFLPACLMIATLTGCAELPIPVARSLPAVPERLMSPVKKPYLYKGQDARAALRLTDSALNEANSRLVGSLGWYENVRKEYGGK